MPFGVDIGLVDRCGCWVIIVSMEKSTRQVEGGNGVAFMCSNGSKSKR